MNVVDHIQNKKKSTVSNAVLVKQDDLSDANNSTKNQQIDELKEALHNALDMVEGKKLRKCLKYILNG